MNSVPRISIVTPCLNSIHTIRDTLESVAGQDYPHLEHIVIDGGSTDGTLEVILSFPHVRWVSGKDDGHYHAMNKGIQLASGDAVAILNADDCYTPGTLAKVGAALADHPEWDALFGDHIFVDGSGREIFRRREACWDSQIVRYGFPLVMHQALFVRKTTYDRLGLYRHQDFKNACDYEFLMRLATARCRVGHLPKLFYAIAFTPMAKPPTGVSWPIPPGKPLAFAQNTECPAAFFGLCSSVTPASNGRWRSSSFLAPAISSQAGFSYASTCLPRRIFHQIAAWTSCNPIRAGGSGRHAGSSHLILHLTVRF